MRKCAKNTHTHTYTHSACFVCRIHLKILSCVYVCLYARANPIKQFFKQFIHQRENNTNLCESLCDVGIRLCDSAYLHIYSNDGANVCNSPSSILPIQIPFTLTCYVIIKQIINIASECAHHWGASFVCPIMYACLLVFFLFFSASFCVRFFQVKEKNRGISFDLFHILFIKKREKKINKGEPSESQYYSRQKGTLCYFVGHSRFVRHKEDLEWEKSTTYQPMQSQRKRTPSHLTFAAFVLNPFLARLYTPIFINLLSASISLYELM